MLTKVSLADLVNKYDLFIIDLCGVLHDGCNVFPEALEAIKYIQHEHKSIIFLSNSPNPSSQIKTFLSNNNISLKDRDKIVSSYDYFVQCVSENDELKNKNYFNLGTNQNLKLINEINIVSKLEEADYIAITFFKDSAVSIPDEILNNLQRAASLGLEGICINPDLSAPHGVIDRDTPGYFAKLYEDRGGKVNYYGKPVPGIYEFALGNASLGKSKILAIGDSLNTDITGANSIGIDSLLVYDKGIYRSENFADANNAEKAFLEAKASPTYILASLSLNSSN